MIAPIAILFLLVVGLLAAIRYRHKPVTRVTTIAAGVVVAIGCAWLAYYAIALSSVKCLGSCG